MHFKSKHQIGREQFSKTFSSFTNHVSSGISPCYLKACKSGIFLLLLPAIAIGCSPGVLSVDYDAARASAFKISYTGSFSESTLDILTFENDWSERLDSYQRLEHFSSDSTWATSTDGDKIFFFCLNSQRDRYDWADIRSYSSLRKVVCNLENEKREAPAMTGEYRGKAGEEICDIQFIPLASKVYLESLKCDFRGTPYSGMKLTEVRAYLTNINATCGLLHDADGENIRIINAGMLNQYDVEKFQDRSLILQEIASELGRGDVGTTEGFLCYPQAGDTSRSTRLVIEGMVGNNRYYWPIEVCPEGISRNCIYVFRITIRRKGVSDPDSLIRLSDIELKLEVKPWKEKEDYQVHF